PDLTYWPFRHVIHNFPTGKASPQPPTKINQLQSIRNAKIDIFFSNALQMASILACMALILR
ncbi:MAG: hypothetical protein K2L24_03665, partial [Opitutales bacterium]|nr:hypothetical protein [Opitutales bacterium]